MPTRLSTKSEWARAHGFTPAYVTKLLKQGKIREAANGRIDIDDADRRLSATSERFRNVPRPTYDEITQPKREPPRPAERPTVVPQRKPVGRPPRSREDDLDDDPYEEEDPSGGLREDELPRSHLPDALLRARIKKEREDGLIKEMERKRRQGELVDAEEVRSASQARAVAEREALLAWPRRVSADMAVELGVEERLLLQVQQKYIREFLAERSKQPTRGPQMDLNE